MIEAEKSVSDFRIDENLLKRYKDHIRRPSECFYSLKENGTNCQQGNDFFYALDLKMWVDLGFIIIQTTNRHSLSASCKSCSETNQVGMQNTHTLTHSDTV